MVNYGEQKQTWLYMKTWYITVMNVVESFSDIYIHIYICHKTVISSLISRANRIKHNV